MKKTLLFIFKGILLLGTMIIISNQACASPMITETYAYIDYRADDVFFGVPGGLKLSLQIATTDSGGWSALTGPGSSEKATSDNASFPFLQPMVLTPVTSYSMTHGITWNWGHLLTGSSQFPNVTGTYTFTVTNTSSQSTTSTSHNLNRPEIIPLPTNLAFSDQTTTPVFTFNDPNPTPGPSHLNRLYRVDIMDDTNNNIFISGTLTTPSFAVPPGILQPGMLYDFRAISLDYDTTENPGTNPLISNRENMSMSFAVFQPAAVPEPSTMLLLGSGLLGLWGARKKFKK